MEDKRLQRIWKLFRLYGLAIVDKGWNMKAKTFLITMFMIMMQMNDLRDVVETMLLGKFDWSKNLVIITSLQIQTITTYRLYLLLSRRNAFVQLMRSVTEEFPSWIQKDYIKDSIIKSSKKGTLICWIYTAQLIANATLFPMITILQTKELHMPLTDSPSFQVQSYCRLCYMALGISLAIAWNLLLFTLIMIVCAHLEHLAIGMELEHVDPHLTACAIRNFVDRYNRIRDFVDMYNGMFSVLNAVQPFFAGFSIVASLLVFNGNQQSYTFVGIASAHMFELFMYCYAGDQVAEKSQSLGERIYATNWYDMSPANKKSILQIVQQCKRPFTVRAGIFGDFSMQMFSTTMKTTYSVWTVVSQTKQMQRN